MRKGFLVVLTLFLLGLPAMAGTASIISVDAIDPYYTGSMSIDADHAVAVAFSLDTAFTPWGLSINVQPNLMGAGLFEAFLTNSYGPSVDTTFYSNEIGRTSFWAPSEPMWVTLVGWTDYLGAPIDSAIGPGQYYLIVGSADPNTVGYWTTTATTDNVLLTANASAHQGDTSGLQFWADSDSLTLNAGYLPGSAFQIDTLGNGELMYDLSTPEPSTLCLIAGALSLLALRRRAA